MADFNNQKLRAVSPNGVTSTLAGSGSAMFGDGIGTAAHFYSPSDVACDAAGFIYVVDTNNHRLRKVSPGGVVATLAGSGGAAFADGQNSQASFNAPQGVAVDPVAGTVFVADTSNQRIRAVSPSGLVTTVCGSGATGWVDGAPTVAALNTPSALAFIPATGALLLADRGNHVIRAISKAGVVSTLAGTGVAGFSDGSSAAAQFNSPAGVALDGAGATVLVADSGNNRVRAVALSSGATTTVIGRGVAGSTLGAASVATLNSPQGVAVDAMSGALYVCDSAHVVRRVNCPSMSPSATVSPRPTAGSSLSPSPAAPSTPSSA